MGFDIKGPEPTVQEIAEKQRTTNYEVKPTFGLADPYKYDLNYHKMADFLGLDEEERTDFNLAKKIAFIRDFTNEQNEADAMLKIKDMIRQLGVNTKGKELLGTLFQYTRLVSDRETTRAKMKELDRNSEEYERLKVERQNLEKEMRVYVNKPAQIPLAKPPKPEVKVEPPKVEPIKIEKPKPDPRLIKIKSENKKLKNQSEELLKERMVLERELKELSHSIQTL